MYGSGSYGKQNTAVGERQKDDYTADTFYELFSKASDLCVFYGIVFSGTRSGSYDKSLCFRHNRRNSDSIYNERHCLQRRTCSLCYGASQLPYAGSKECMDASLGKGERLSAKSFYGNIYSNDSNLVSSNL